MIDYTRTVGAAGDHDALVAELTRCWLHAYRAMCYGPTNVLEVTVTGFTYLFDFTSALEDPVHDDRVVVAFGRSAHPSGARDASRQRGFPAPEGHGDRGHLIPHGSGGGLEINIIHQNAFLNRGRTTEGKRYRQMERYCADHAGTLFFNRPMYEDPTARPSRIEFGILQEHSVWAEVFANPR